MNNDLGPTQWSGGLRCVFGAARLLELWVRIPPGTWNSVSFECVCCPVEDSASALSLVQRRPVECGVSKCDFEASILIIKPTRCTNFSNLFQE